MSFHGWFSCHLMAGCYVIHGWFSCHFMAAFYVISLLVLRSSHSWLKLLCHSWLVLMSSCLVFMPFHCWFSGHLIAGSCVMSWLVLMSFYGWFLCHFMAGSRVISWLGLITSLLVHRLVINNHKCI